MIVGVGVDVVNVPRFAAVLRRTPALRDRLFTSGELITDAGRVLTETSLAARFAAKEAVAKALGAPAGLFWHDCEVLIESDGRPVIKTTGSVSARAAQLGVATWHVSLSHDGDIAIASVIAEGV